MLSKYQWLRTFISQFISGPNADALLESLADEAQDQENLSIAVSNQLYISTSSGPYTDKRLAQYNIVRPGNLGMSDVSFIKMGIAVKAQKMLPGVIHTVLDTFYGDDAVRAYTICTQPEPYNLINNADLILELEDGVQRTIFMQSQDFTDISQATAAEVAGVITQFFASQSLLAYATVYTDQTTGLNYVKIYGGAMGPYSLIKIDGGYVQDILEWPTIRDTDLSSNTTVWQITRTIGSTIRFRWYSGPAPALDEVFTGDSALVYGPQFVSLGFGGTFAVTNVRPPEVAPSFSAGWFEITNESIAFLSSTIPNQAPPPNTVNNTYSVIVSQAAFDDLKFFLGKKNTPYSKAQYALAWEPNGNLLKVYLPATTQVVERQLQGATHMHALYPTGNLNGSFGSSSVQAAKIVVINDYAIGYYQQGYDNNATGGTLDYTGAPGGGVPINYVAREQQQAIVVCTEPHGIIGDIQWQPGNLYLTGAQVWFSGLLYTATQDSGPGHGGASDPSLQLKWETTGPGLNYSSTIVSVIVANEVLDNLAFPFPGAYMPDLTANYDLQGTYVTTLANIVQGTRIQTLLVKGVFPNTPGLVLFDLGNENQEGPVSYLGAQVANGPTSAAIVSASQNGNSITVTCSAPTGAVLGNSITIAGSSNVLLDGTFTVTSVPSVESYVCFNPTSQVEFGTGGVSTSDGIGAQSTLLISPSYNFQFNHSVGAPVNLLVSDQAYVPTPDGSDYSDYITGTADALTFAEQLIQQITAAGINLELIVIYPSDVGFGNEGDSTTTPPLSDIVYIYGP